MADITGPPRISHLQDGALSASGIQGARGSSVMELACTAGASPPLGGRKAVARQPRRAAKPRISIQMPWTPQPLPGSVDRLKLESDGGRGGSYRLIGKFHDIVTERS